MDVGKFFEMQAEEGEVDMDDFEEGEFELDNMEI